MTGCFMLLLPLAIAGSGIGVSGGLHEWSVGMLEVIGGQMGVSQALAMVPLVRRQRARWVEGYGGRGGYRVLSERECWL